MQRKKSSFEGQAQAKPMPQEFPAFMFRPVLGPPFAVLPVLLPACRIVYDAVRNAQKNGRGEERIQNAPAAKNNNPFALQNKKSIL